MSSELPNILFIMTDQQRFDTVGALGNPYLCTPNIDRLVARGVTFSRAYATCPVCVAARYIIRTGCEPPTTRVFNNAPAPAGLGQYAEMEERCGPYLGRVMSGAGYRTFGVGKFHTSPWDEDLGYETFLRSEEMYNSTSRAGDSYASWLAREHPEFDFLEQPMGERTEMYYLPQRSPLPAELGVEAWTAAQAIEQISQHDDRRPYFGFVSFVGPHPPLAPPIPFNRMYDPDRLPEPVLGNIEQDYLDEEIPFMRHAIWADAVNPSLARIVKARYYGEISYIDSCLGRVLDAVEATSAADNTLICFFSDHGDLLGDHHGWQKQNFFEGACRIPFLVSWPSRFRGKTSRGELVSLADLFGIATRAGGVREIRQGIDVLGALEGESASRPYLLGMTELPGSQFFKIMVVKDEWKYIFMANGAREQLFNLQQDPQELFNRARENSEVREQLHRIAVDACGVPGAEEALGEDCLKSYPFRERSRSRIYQFDESRGVSGFTEKPKEVLLPVFLSPNEGRSSPPLDDLGLDLNPGDSHYRAFVGPPADYDVVAAMTFNLLTTMGLRQHHSLLDLGCGSLRVGRLLIPYLNKRKYVGIEPNEWLVREGIRREVGKTLVQIKQPRFLFSDSPATLSAAMVTFDFVVAQSIFSHCGLDLIIPWLSSIAASLAPTGAFLATFLPAEEDSEETGWIYPGCVKFKADTLSREASNVGLRFEVLDWRHPRQTWALFAGSQFDSTWFQNKPLTWNTMLESKTAKND